MPEAILPPASEPAVENAFAAGHIERAEAHFPLRPGSVGRNETAPIRVLVFSTLYPSSTRPNHGIFVERRVLRVAATGKVEVKVVAPVPWFPSAHRMFRTYALFAGTPGREDWNGVDVRHPRYLLPPKVGMTIAPGLLAAACYSTLLGMIKGGFDFDVIDAHYYYPDGVAAAILARQLGKPLVITARGSDLNLIARYAAPRRMMAWAARHAAASVGVCGALTQRLREIGAPAESLHVLRNGVDLEQFRPVDRAATRKELGWNDGLRFLSVGNLIELKGHHLAIAAIAELPEAHLVIVGNGHMRKRLERQAAALGVAGRVVFTGAVAPAQLVKYYGASDALILASSREGWANVLLEAMACGTPVVTTRIPGTLEVLSDGGLVEWMEERSGPALAAALRRLMERRIDRAAVRDYAKRFSWDETTQGQLALFESLRKSRSETRFSEALG